MVLKGYVVSVLVTKVAGPLCDAVVMVMVLMLMLVAARLAVAILILILMAFSDSAIVVAFINMETTSHCDGIGVFQIKIRMGNIR